MRNVITLASVVLISSASPIDRSLAETEARYMANATLAAAALCTQIAAEGYAVRSRESAELIFSTAVEDCGSDWAAVGPAWEVIEPFDTKPAWRIAQIFQDTIKPRILRSIVRARSAPDDHLNAEPTTPTERAF